MCYNMYFHACYIANIDLPHMYARPSIEEVKESPTVRDSESHVGETPGTSSQHVGRRCGDA